MAQNPTKALASAEERIAALDRRITLSREAMDALQQKYGDKVYDLEGLVFSLRSALAKADQTQRASALDALRDEVEVIGAQ